MTETHVKYGSFVIRPVVTERSDGRFGASAVVCGIHDSDERVVGVEADFGDRQEAIDRAIELAMGEIDERRIASDHHVKP